MVDGSQLALALGRSKSGEARSDEVAFNGKTALIPLTGSSAGLTLAYGLLGARSRHQGLRLTNTVAKLVYTAPTGPWLLHANAGWARDTDASSDSTLWNLAAERTGIGPLDLMAEVFGDDHDAAWLNAAVRWRLIDDQFSVDASYAVQLDSARARLVSIGLKFTF